MESPLRWRSLRLWTIIVSSWKIWNTAEMKNDITALVG